MLDYMLILYYAVLCYTMTPSLLQVCNRALQKDPTSDQSGSAFLLVPVMQSRLIPRSASAYQSRC
eukprot:12654389-Heterocapsa_arctica.AAC.1